MWFNKYTPSLNVCQKTFPRFTINFQQIIFIQKTKICQIVLSHNLRRRSND